jgi:hypothetical protein
VQGKPRQRVALNVVDEDELKRHATEEIDPKVSPIFRRWRIAAVRNRFHVRQTANARKT